jgi:hypothetical protein
MPLPKLLPKAEFEPARLPKMGTTAPTVMADFSNDQYAREFMILKDNCSLEFIKVVLRSTISRWRRQFQYKFYRGIKATHK